MPERREPTDTSGAPHDPATRRARSALLVGPRSLLLEAVGEVLSDLGVTVHRDGHAADAAPADLVLLFDPDDATIPPSADGRVIVVTVTTLPPAAQLELLLHGADGVVAADGTTAELAAALAQVIDGGLAVGPDVIHEAIDRLRADARRPVELTGRELALLRSIAEGDTAKQAARRMQLSRKTIENVQTRLYRKLGVRNGAQAVAVAHRTGVLAGGADEPEPDTVVTG